MVKSYLRYESGLSFGVIASNDCNISFDNTGTLLLSPALESLGLWNLRQGVCTKFLSPTSDPSIPSSSRRVSSPLITSISASPADSSAATGYADGSIRIWDCSRGACVCTLKTHKGAVTCLRYNKNGSSLASGSNDKDIIVWDVVGEIRIFCLHGHTDQVTDVVFLESANKLVSCSKDKYMKVWDLHTGNCVQTIGGHYTEIWSLDIDVEERHLVTGSSDPELRFYQVGDDYDGDDVANGESVKRGGKRDVLKFFGDIKRQCKERTATVRFNHFGNLFACQAAGKKVEIFTVLDKAESKRKAKRRIHRKEKKLARELSETKTNENDDKKSQEDVASQPIITVSDIFKPLHVLRASTKICSISFSSSTHRNAATIATMALSLNNNTLESYSIQTSTVSKTHAIELPGHRSDIRSLALSSDDTMLMSTSHNAVKFWNPGTGSCLRTVESKYGLCCSFVPGNQFALIGTKSGALEIVDVGSGNCVEVIEAHSDSIRSITSIPDGSGFITGSADNDVKFWEYQIEQKSNNDSQKMQITNVRTLKMAEDVLVVRVSPDAKYIAVAILDSSVRVFFMDSLKFCLSLYGHKLPVLCMDISSDGDLIITGSADKNLRIWGLDFGDCHKSIFAHDDSVMDVQFVRNTHYVFSVGKDCQIKYWDADKFELLLTLDGHHKEIWCMTISHRGDFIITGAHDRSIRRWDRTNEPFFIEEEKEKRLEEMLESGRENLSGHSFMSKDNLPEEGMVGLVGKMTKETLTAADLIIDSLDMAEEELKRMDQYKEDGKSEIDRNFKPNVMMCGRSPSEHVLHAISSVHPNDIEYTLTSLTFSDALKLFTYLKEWGLNPLKVELVGTISGVLLQIHYNQLISTPAAGPILMVLRDILKTSLKEAKNIRGIGLAAANHTLEMASLRSDAPFHYAKAKLLEIRSKQAKRQQDNDEVREKKRKKISKETPSHDKI